MMDRSLLTKAYYFFFSFTSFFAGKAYLAFTEEGMHAVQAA